MCSSTATTARAAAFRPASSRPAMVILLAITFGLDAAQRIAPQALVERMIPLGVLIYAGTGHRRPAARQELSRLFGARPRLRARARARDLSRRGRRAGHGVRHHDGGVLRLRRAGPLMATLTNLVAALQLRHHHLPDDGRASTSWLPAATW